MESGPPAQAFLGCTESQLSAQHCTALGVLVGAQEGGWDLGIMEPSEMDSAQGGTI